MTGRLARPDRSGLSVNGLDIVESPLRCAGRSASGSNVAVH